MSVSVCLVSFLHLSLSTLTMHATDAHQYNPSIHMPPVDNATTTSRDEEDEAAGIMVTIDRSPRH